MDASSSANSLTVAEYAPASALLNQSATPNDVTADTLAKGVNACPAKIVVHATPSVPVASVYVVPSVEIVSW